MKKNETVKELTSVVAPKGEKRNEIVVYQPDGVTRVDVRFDGETVWLLQQQIADLFGCSLENVRLHLKNIFAFGELSRDATSKESLEVRLEGSRRVSRRSFYSSLRQGRRRCKMCFMTGRYGKDLGRKCFTLKKLDASEIVGLKGRV